jgi:hypothetical protein
MRFEVILATGVKIVVFWDVEFLTLMIEAVRSSKTSVSINQTTWYNVPADRHLRMIYELENIWY